MISIVVPAYNESAVIVSTLNRIRLFMRQHYGADFELIVADDGSTDDTATLVRSQSDIRLLSLPHGGKGAAVKAGVLASRGDKILFTDADNSTDIEHLPAFIQALESCDMVIGSRQVDSAAIVVAQPWFKQFLGRLGNVMIQLLLVPGVKDTQCGFKLFRSNAKVLFEQQRRMDWAFDFEILFLARKRGLRIQELPVRWINNFDTKVKPLAYLTTLLAVFSVQYNYLTHRYTL